MASGCVHSYQPLSGLHDPVVIDPKARNFEDLRLTIRCIPGEDLTPQEASVLCQMVGTLFVNQGAQVSTVTTGRLFNNSGLAGEDEPEEEDPPTDLVIELRARTLQESDDPLLWVLCYSTFTLVPAVREFTFAQDVTIRDGSGFLLLTDTMQGRVVRRFGVGVWAGNKLLDWVWRDDADKQTGDAANRDLSADLYRQLSQLVFNAKMQWEVIQESAPEDEEASWK